MAASRAPKRPVCWRGAQAGTRDEPLTAAGAGRQGRETTHSWGALGQARQPGPVPPTAPRPGGPGRQLGGSRGLRTRPGALAEAERGGLSRRGWGATGQEQDSGPPKPPRKAVSAQQKGAASKGTQCRGGGGPFQKPRQR